MGTWTPPLCHIHHGQAMKKLSFKVLLAAGGILCTAVPWGDPSLPERWPNTWSTAMGGR